MEWTCCACEHQVDERYFDTEERMCDECMNLAYPDSITDKSIQLGASVVKSKSFGDLPRIASRTAPPTT